jgi:hypothetical protein
LLVPAQSCSISQVEFPDPNQGRVREFSACSPVLTSGVLPCSVLINFLFEGSDSCCVLVASYAAGLVLEPPVLRLEFPISSLCSHGDFLVTHTRSLMKCA